MLHKDLMPRNILWNKKTERAMVIDSERAEVEQRLVLGVVSANRKRKRIESSIKQGEVKSSFYKRELRQAALELNGILPIRCGRC